MGGPESHWAPQVAWGDNSRNVMGLKVIEAFLQDRCNMDSTWGSPHLRVNSLSGEGLDAMVSLVWLPELR